MLYRLGKLIYHRRRAVLAAWLIALVVSSGFALRTGEVLKSTIGRSDTESQRGLNIMERELHLPPSVLILSYSSDKATVDTPGFRAAMEASLAGARSLEHVLNIDTYYTTGHASMVSMERTATYALVWLDVGLDEAIDLMPAVRAAVEEPRGLRLRINGAPAIYRELEEATQRDLQRAEIIAFPVVLIALVLIFGGIVASGVPVLMGGVSLVLTLAVLYLLGQMIPLSVFAQNVASLVGLGVAIDYSLFIVSRFREELGRRTVEESIAVTMTSAGRAVLFSGIASMMGLAGLLLVDFSFLKSLGLAGVAVIGVSVLVSLTLVPAMLGMLGSRVNTLSIRRPERVGTGFWRRFSLQVMKRPLWFFVPSALLLVVLGAPFLRVNLGPIWANTLPKDSPAREGWNFLQEKFGVGELTPLVVVVQAPGSILEPRNIGLLYDYTHKLAALPGVIRVDSIVDVSAGLPKEAYQFAYQNPAVTRSPAVKVVLDRVVREGTTIVRVYTAWDLTSEEAKDFVRRARAVEIDPSLTKYVSGATASLRDSIDALYGDFLLVLLVVVGSIYLAMLVLFRSVVLALKAVLLNGLSMLASFGALVFIFHEGHFQGLLNFQADGSIEASLPVMLFCVVFGLSMDYEVFLLSRIREEYDRIGDNTEAVASGMERSGRIITSAAMVVVVVGLAFAAGDVILAKSLGLGLALGVLIDATVVRALMAPSLMRLLGEWNWWAPQPLLRLLPRWQVHDE